MYNYVYILQHMYTYSDLGIGIGIGIIYLSTEFYKQYVNIIKNSG